MPTQRDLKPAFSWTLEKKDQTHQRTLGECGRLKEDMSKTRADKQRGGPSRKKEKSANQTMSHQMIIKCNQTDGIKMKKVHLESGVIRVRCASPVSARCSPAINLHLHCTQEETSESASESKYTNEQKIFLSRITSCFSNSLAWQQMIARPVLL